MNIKTRKRLSLALVACLCLTLVVGSFAFFTDRAEIDGSATAGNLAVGMEGTISADLLLGGDDGITNSETLDNWNPGDSVNFDFTVSNEGNKALRAQETLTLTVKGQGGTYGVFEEADGSMFTIACADGSEITPASAKLDTATNTWTLVYHINEFALSAKDGGEKLADVAGNADVAAAGKMDVAESSASTVRTYKLVFNADATNEYQDAEIDILVHVDTIQYANSDSVTENTIWNYTGVNGIEQEEVYTDENGAAVAP